MQIDFHHGVTYCLARLAGFDRPHAEIVAHAAQYVDDAIEEGSIHFDNGQVYERISSAHKTLDYRNFEQLSNQKVWIPFHFLPGNDGMPAGQHTSPNIIDRTICSPNSYVAQDMVRECIRQRQAAHGLHRLGITMHVFADTWAHQGFAGVSHKINRASELLDEQGNPDPQKRQKIRDFFAKGMGEQLIDRVTGFFVSEVLPLGHGAVLSYPDKPFLKWGYTNGLGEVVQRDNPKDFLEAAQEMCVWMQRYIKGEPKARVPGLTGRDRETIIEMINGLTEWESKLRHDHWLEAVAQGKFSFGAEEVRYVAAGDGSWVATAFGTTQPNFADPRHRHSLTPNFAQSNWKLFHDALLAHQSFVMGELLPSYDLQLA
jgi:hypothetical protein